MEQQGQTLSWFEWSHLHGQHTTALPPTITPLSEQATFIALEEQKVQEQDWEMLFLILSNLVEIWLLNTSENTRPNCPAPSVQGTNSQY